MIHVLYNPLAANRSGEANARKISEVLHGEALEFLDVTQLDPVRYLEESAPDEMVVLSGGDGTLHYFINQCGGKAPKRPVYYYPGGSGNDFMADVREREQSGVVLLNPYLERLPAVTVNGRREWFLNGVGYGIDGYCCEEGDRLRAASSGSVNYTAIAVKGLLFHFKPRAASVTVDGVTRRYDHVWLAPAMNGRYYGGGMMVAPAQDRLGAGGTLSVVVMHHPGKLKTLAVFPSIFKGGHVRHTEMVEVLTGRAITVRFDRPTALQIDGETVPGVTSYSACAAAGERAAGAEAGAV